MTNTRPYAEGAPAQLYEALLKAFSMMDCKKALYASEGDLQLAAQNLTDGHWRTAKLVSWNHEGLAESTRVLSKELELSEALVRDVLMNCAGSRELTRRKLLKQPLLG